MLTCGQMIADPSVPQPERDAWPVRLLLTIILSFWLMLPSVATAQKPEGLSLEAVIWVNARESGNPDYIREYLSLYPNGLYVERAMELLSLLDPGSQHAGEAQEPDPDPAPVTRDAKGVLPTGLKPSKPSLDARPPTPDLPDGSSPSEENMCGGLSVGADSGEGRMLCVTFLQSANYTFARNCESQTYGFAGLSVSREVFMSEGETLLLRENANGMHQVTGDRPTCYQLAGDRPEKLSHFSHFVLDYWERSARICDFGGKCR